MGEKYFRMKLIHKDGKLTKKLLSWQYQKKIPIDTAEVATRKLGTAWHLFILILGGVKSSLLHLVLDYLDIMMLFVFFCSNENKMGTVQSTLLNALLVA